MNGEIAVLNKYPEKDYNVLMSATAMQMTPWHRIIMSEIRIDPNPDNGDVYRQSGNLAFSKQALMKLADAAGIRFVGTDTDRHEDMSVTATVHGLMTKADGLEHQLIGTYTWDVPNRLEQARLDIEKYEQKSKRKLSDTDKAQRMIDVQKFAFMRAETGAMERLVRSALGIQSTYTGEQLAKPFVVTRVIADFAQDPLVRLALGLKMSGQVLTPEEIAAIAAAIRQAPPLQIEQAEPMKELGEGETRQPEAKASGNGNGKVDSPGKLRDTINARAEDNYDPAPATNSQAQTVAMLLEEIWAGQDHAKDNRYGLLKYLFGEEVDSTTKLTLGQASELIKWYSHDQKDETGAFVQQPGVRALANACLDERLRAKGQIELTY